MSYILHVTKGGGDLGSLCQLEREPQFSLGTSAGTGYHWTQTVASDMLETGCALDVLWVGVVPYDETEGSPTDKWQQMRGAQFELLVGVPKNTSLDGGSIAVNI